MCNKRKVYIVRIYPVFFFLILLPFIINTEYGLSVWQIHRQVAAVAYQRLGWLCAKIARPEGVVHTTNDGWDAHGTKCYRYYNMLRKKKEIILKNSCAVPIYYTLIVSSVFTISLMIPIFFFFYVIQLKIALWYIL